MDTFIVLKHERSLLTLLYMYQENDLIKPAGMDITN